MKIYQELHQFPLGTIHPSGFLKDQLLRNKDGMGGHLDELEPEMIAYPYIDKRPVLKWKPHQQDGWGAEISGNYWTGLIKLAFTLQDDALIEKATNWVNAMLKNQKDDGYLGTYNEPHSRIYEDFNAWGTTCCMRGLLAFYEATGREDVMDAIYRCMLWFCDNWPGDQKTTYAGPFIIEMMSLCYKHRPDARLIEFSEDYERFIQKHDIFHLAYTTLLNGDFRYNCNHTAGYGTQTRIHAQLYTVTGKEDYLKATVRAMENMRANAMHMTGSPVSLAEYLAPVSSIAETEYCSYTVFNAAYSYLSAITGEARWGDYMEEAFYNGAQGARKKDEKAIAYLSAPNQLYATDSSTQAGERPDMQVYSPCYTVSCCPVNSVVLLPEFIQGMMLYDDDDNIYMTAYGPCFMEWRGLRIEEKTLYPFRNSIEFAITGERHCSLFFKIPAWCKKYTICVNGTPASIEANEKGYAELVRNWHTGDKVTLTFDMQTEVITVDDSKASRKFPLAIRRGVLVYSYHVKEKWIPQGKKLNLPEWDWWNIVADYEEPQVYDHYDAIGLRRYNFEWNIALDEKLKSEDIVVKELPIDGYVWENPPIKLELKGYRALYMCAPYCHKTLEPFEDKQYVDKAVDVELVPYGCTNLRITYFPKADLTNPLD